MGRVLPVCERRLFGFRRAFSPSKPSHFYPRAKFSAATGCPNFRAKNDQVKSTLYSSPSNLLQCKRNSVYERVLPSWLRLVRLLPVPAGRGCNLTIAPPTEEPVIASTLKHSAPCRSVSTFLTSHRFPQRLAENIFHVKNRSVSFKILCRNGSAHDFERNSTCGTLAVRRWYQMFFTITKIAFFLLRRKISSYSYSHQACNTTWSPILFAHFPILGFIGFFISVKQIQSFISYPF